MLNVIVIIRMHGVQKRVQPLVHALARTAKDLFISRIDVQKFRDASICYPNDIIDILGELTKSLLAFMERLFGAFAVRYILGSAFKIENGPTLVTHDRTFSETQIRAPSFR